jgi:uncharacterized protein (TIGR03086 family)
MADHADRYRALAARLNRVVEEVPPEAWDRASPCEGWAARDVLAHVADTEWDFLTRTGLAPEGASLPDDPFEAWPQVRDLVQALLDDPLRASTPYEGFFGPSTIGATLDQFYTLDLLVHAWDIARATGLVGHEAMPVDEVRRGFADCQEWGDGLRQPGGFGPPVPVGDGAGEQERFLAFLGREP